MTKYWWILMYGTPGSKQSLKMLNLKRIVEVIIPQRLQWLLSHFVYVFAACDWPSAWELHHMTIIMTSSQKQCGRQRSCDTAVTNLPIHDLKAVSVNCLTETVTRVQDHCNQICFTNQTILTVDFQGLSCLTLRCVNKKCVELSG